MTIHALYLGSCFFSMTVWLFPGIFLLLKHHLYLAGGREIYLEPLLLLCRFILLLARFRYFRSSGNFWKLGRHGLRLLNLRGRRARVRELLSAYVLLHERADLVVCYLTDLLVHR